MTTEQVLEKIKQNRGEDALRDSKQLIGLFVDYSKSQLQPQANVLQIFLSCQGNTRILDLRDAPRQAQQVGFHHLIQEMVNNHYMQEAAALEVCGTFWRVAVGTEPPVSADNPAPPSPAPEPDPPEPVLTAEEMFQQGHACHQNRDYPEAVKWYRKAAEQGNARAQLDLGFAYENGLGVERNYVEAVRWFRKAAEQGYAPAQDRMAYCYDKGIGVDRNLEKAVEWCKRACQQDFPGSKRHLNQLEEKLSEERPDLFPELSSQEFGILNGVLVKYNGGAANVVVPGGIKRIGPRAFQNNQVIRSVTLPDKLLGIGTDAFSGCTNLREVVVPGSVVAIDLECFAECKNLKKLVLLPGVQKLIFGEKLAHLYSLNITVPDSVHSVTWSRFSDAERETRMKHPKRIIASAEWGSRFHQFLEENPDFRRQDGVAAVKVKFALFRPEHSKQEKCLLTLGWVCLLISLVLFISCIGIGVTEELGGMLFAHFSVGFLALPVAGRQYLLWNQTKSWEPKRTIPRFLSACLIAFDSFFAVYIVIFTAVSATLIFSDDVWVVFLLFLPFPVYVIWWFIWQRYMKD